MKPIVKPVSTYFYLCPVKLVLAPKLIITVCGILQAQAVFKGKDRVILAETSDETLIEQVLKIKVDENYTISGYYKEETFLNATGDAQTSTTVTLSSINNTNANPNKTLLLLLYKHAMNNYDNKDLVNAYATLDTVKKQFENLWNFLSPSNTFKDFEPMMSEDMKKEYTEHMTKTLGYVDKFATLRFSSD